MSIPAINWALSQEDLKSSTKFVLVALANYANQLGHVWPSIACLSHDTCQDRKTVLENISRLIEKGLLTDTGKRVGRTNQIPVYQLCSIPEKQEQSRKRDGITVPFFPPNSPVFPVKQSRKRDTEPLYEPLRNQGGGKRPPSVLDLKDRISAKERLLEEIRYDDGARPKRDKLRLEIKNLNRQMAEME